MLQEVNAFGERYRHPLCLECLPPHREGCDLGEYLEKQALWMSWRANDDLADDQFWDRFGIGVPGCHCPGRSKDLRLKAATERQEEARAFRLSWGRPVTAWTWRTLRKRLGVMNGKRKASAELEILALASGESSGQVLERLRVFEMEGQRPGS